ncbi:hypothetical protein RHO15_08915 [Utexia brackfieldae]|uniref:serine O-acetyltransferase n=1 Tax=Utexia brackfieldae TaxID=3074108 RepID=UPI00370D03FD
MKYIHILIFLMTHDLTFLKKCWEAEFIINKPFTWRRLFRRLRKNNNTFIAWWRLANAMYHHGNEKQKEIGLTLGQKVNIKYGIDIMVGTKIGYNFTIGHFSGIVIGASAVIGENFSIRQNTTIGGCNVKIGNNVYIGANSCVVSCTPNQPLVIGDNVTVGAMSFINKDIPDNCTVYTEKTNKIVIKQTN